MEITTSNGKAVLAKADSPLIHIQPQSFIDNFQPEMQKQSPNKLRFDNLYLAYKKNSWVNRSIRLIASSVTAGGWKAVPVNPFDTPNIKAAEGLVKFLSQPNPTRSFDDIVVFLITSLLICGNGYLEVSRLNGKTAKKSMKKSMKLAKDSEYALLIEESINESLQELDGLPTALWPIDARTMSVQTDAHGTVTGYKQILVDGTSALFTPEQIMHFKIHGPCHEVYGESPLECLESELTLDLYRQAYLTGQLVNGTKIGYIFNMENSTSDTVARFQEFLNMRNRGPANANANLIVEGALNVSSPNIAPYDGANDLGNGLRDRIISCLGIPISKFGAAAAGTLGGDNSENANKTYYESTVKPLARLIERQFNMFLIPDLQVIGVNGYIVQIITEDVDLIQTKSETVVSLKNAGILTTNEGRVILGQTPYNEIGSRLGDVPTVLTSSGIEPLEDAEKPLPPPLEPVAQNVQQVPKPVVDDTAKALKSLTRQLKKALENEVGS